MFEIIRKILTTTAADPADDADWVRDPLSHPALERMTPMELADLPLGRVRFADNGNGVRDGDEKRCA